FTLSVSELSNFEAGTRIFLKDKLNPASEFELTESTSYNFSSEVTSPTTDRFSLIFRAPGVATSVEKSATTCAQAFVNTANLITLIAPAKSEYAIFNSVGQKMTDGLTTNDKTIVNQLSKSGVYIVKLNINGKQFNSKVIIK
ncbi:MAG: T9SS type A sorting domain-containing protein, partial [Paludibacter sp.]